MSSPTSRPLLPILIVPGFMSSGLVVRRSALKENWEGKRIWANFASMGIEASAFASGEAAARKRRDVSTTPAGSSSSCEDDEDDDKDCEEPTDEESQERRHEMYKNMWLQHMALSLHDMISENPDVEVRPMEGLAAVDYLEPGVFTGLLSYVFGPVIKALKAIGYRENENLDAAPYDWRLPPSVLEERDGYFTDAMEKVERLYKANGNTPVVLLCHSLGCKVGHYLLNFANDRCEGWSDRYVHTYMPVGGPHLGAPKAMRASVTGDKMGLDMFLTDHEGTVFSRSWGSGPWLIPGALPGFAPSNVHLRREGAFEITVETTIRDVESLLDHREDCDKPKKLRLIFEFGTESVVTEFSRLEGGAVAFEGKYTFSTGPEGPTTMKKCCWCFCRCCRQGCARCACCRCGCCYRKSMSMNEGLFVYLCEPGVQVARKRKKKCEYCFADTPMWKRFISCLWVFELVFYCIYFWTYKIWISIADACNKCTRGSSILAYAEPIDMANFVGEADGIDTQVELHQTLCCVCCKKRAAVTLDLNIRWISPVKKDGTHVHLAERINNKSRHIGEIVCPKHKDACIEASSGYDIVQKDGNDSLIRAVETIYDSDNIDPRNRRSAETCPPVKNVKAIYGINCPTEVGAVYRRRKSVIARGDKTTQMYKLDDQARLQTNDIHGYVLEGGILKETKSTPQMLASADRFKHSAVAKDFKKCSGDGTVPFWSLQHVHTWEKDTNVSVTEIDGALHREILADERFHSALIDYVRAKTDADAEEKV